jgi:hypothetical protein
MANSFSPGSNWVASKYNPENDPLGVDLESISSAVLATTGDSSQQGRVLDDTTLADPLSKYTHYLPGKWLCTKGSVACCRTRTHSQGESSRNVARFHKNPVNGRLIATRKGLG